MHAQKSHNNVNKVMVGSFNEKLSQISKQEKPISLLEKIIERMLPRKRKVLNFKVEQLIVKLLQFHIRPRKFTS